MIRGPLRTLGKLLLAAAITAMMLEVSLRIARPLGIFNARERPTRPATFYVDSSPTFGIWHRPNASFLARDDCFEVRYESNSWGARDRERALESARERVLVLGDSFVEGIGVEFGKRMTDLLESRTGVPHLNFGTAGNFSSVQQWLLYEDLASRFDHDLVLIFTLPNNDFIENDYERWWEPYRYRPYLVKRGGEFELYYPIAFDEVERRAESQLRWNRLYNALYLYRFVSWLDIRIRLRLAFGETSPRYGYVGYRDWSELDLERLLWSYRALRDAAGGRPVVVFTIPRYNDLLYQEERAESYELPGRLAAFAEAEPGIGYVDLLPGFVADAARQRRDYASYFHSCDGHWSELGNSIAADIVLRALCDGSAYPGAADCAGSGRETGAPGTAGQQGRAGPNGTAAPGR